MAPRFEQPSTQPIAKANKQAISGIQAIQKKTQQIEQQEKDPQLKLQIASLQVNYQDVLSSLNTSESARVTLDAKLKAETDKGNKLANSYDTVRKQLDAQAAVIKQVNSKWGLGAFAYGAKILARHLLILLAVVVGLGILVTVLGFLFPVFGAALKIAGAFIAAVFNRIRGK